MKAYELQQMVSKQQKDLEDSFSELQTLSAAREELEHRFQDISQTHKDQQEALFKAKDDGTWIPFQNKHLFHVSIFFK